jgi:hypothetical protein
LENDLQPIDYSVVIRQWNEIRDVLKPHWEKTSKLTGAQAREVQFLRDRKIEH